MEKEEDRKRVNGERRGERECEWKKRERERVNGGRGRERESTELLEFVPHSI